MIASYKISKLFYGNLLRAHFNIQNFSDQGLFKQQCSNFPNENSVLITTGLDICYIPRISSIKIKLVDMQFLSGLFGKYLEIHKL